MCVVIIFEGEIGAGKTTAVALFAAQARARGIRVQLVTEPVELWERSGALARLYADPGRRNYEALTYFAASYTLTIASAAGVSADMIVLERSPGSGRLFAEAWRDALGPMERSMYAAWGDAYRLALPLDLARATVVYLKPSLDACMARLAKRGRPAELGISREYLQELRRAHETYLGLPAEANGGKLRLGSDKPGKPGKPRPGKPRLGERWYNSDTNADRLGERWYDSETDLSVRPTLEMNNNWFGSDEQKSGRPPRRGVRQLARLPPRAVAPTPRFSPLIQDARQICTITDDGEPAVIVGLINADVRVSRALDRAAANATGTCYGDMTHSVPVCAAKSPDARFLIIEGEIAAGKSTMARLAASVLAAQGLKVVVIPEPVEVWERTGILRQFYKDPKRYGYAAQTFFTATRCLGIREAITSQPADIYILERSPASDRIFMELQRDTLEPAEMAMYETWCEAYRLIVPSLEHARVLYLKPSLTRCAERLKGRARPGELEDESTAGVTATYQERLRLAHEAFFEKRHPGRFPLMPSSPFGAPLVIGAPLADQDFRTGPPREAISRLILEALV